MLRALCIQTSNWWKLQLPSVSWLLERLLGKLAYSRMEMELDQK